MKDRRLLITGGGGFVAGHVLALAAREWSGDILTTRFGDDPVSRQAQPSIRLDIRDRTAVMAAMADHRPTDILHLAAISAPAEAGRDPAAAWRANVGGALNMAEAAVSCGARQMVFVSTAEVYGRAFLASDCVTEDATPQPMGVYSRSKLAAEQAVADVLLASDCRGTIIRPANHSGPGQDQRFVAPAFAAQVALIEAGRAEPVVKTGNLDPERDFLDVRDVARGYLAVLMADEPQPGVTVLNLGSGRPRRVGEILEVLASAASTPFEVSIDPLKARSNEIPRACVNAERLKALYGWHPQIAFEMTIRDVLDDWRGRVGSRSPSTS